MRRSRHIILTLLLALIAMPLYGQKLSLGYLYPAGGQVGTTVEIEAGGLNINKATKVLFNHPGIEAQVEPLRESAAEKRKRKRLNDQSSPQLADRVKIRISIAADVPCGFYDLRLQGASGVSNMLPFEVASYPNLLETKKRSTLKQPNMVDKLPAVLCGYVTPGGVDHFSFNGLAGQTIVASVKARRLVPYIADAVPGWFQPVMKIVDSQGHEVAYSDDYHHNVDPVIITTLPKDDSYTVIIHDAIYRGREDFNYRVHIGEIPFVTARYPAYGTVGKNIRQRLEGVNLGSTTAKIKATKVGYNTLTHTSDIGTSDGVSFYALPRGVRLSHCPKQGATLANNAAIADSLTAESKVKRYTIYAERGEDVVVELIGRRNGSRIDALMRLRDGFGKVVAEVDDTEDPLQGLMTFHADPVLRYKPERSQVLILEVEDLHRGSGEQYHYLLRRYNSLPSFNAFVAPANITIPAGGTASFRVDINGKVRRPANLVVEGLPEGFTTSSLDLRRSNKWNVSITAPKNAKPERFPIEVKLEYQTPDGLQTADVVPVDNMMQAFYYTHYLQAAELSLDIAEPSPYRLRLSFDVCQHDVAFKMQSDVIPVKVIIDRDAGFDEPVELLLGNKNRIFSLEPISLQAGETEKTVYIKVNQSMLARYRNARNLPYWQMSIVGTVKGEIEKRGKRYFQNAKYRETTPYFTLHPTR
ncbi:MAG: hypothetical protein IJX65_01745 [Alistipes sp.]|nr:hypothetical protein [Alistipes sp.]